MEFNAKLSSREKILKAALRVFGEKGYYEATISEIAKEANITEATIYKYFSNKEELILKIPLKDTQEIIELIDRWLRPIRGCLNKLRTLIYLTLEFYQNNPDYASLFIQFPIHNRKFVETEIYRLQRKWAGYIMNIIKEGIESGELKPDTNIYVMRIFIIGAITHIITSRQLTDRPKNFLELVDPLADMIIEGVSNKQKSNEYNLRITLEPRDSEEKTKPKTVETDDLSPARE